MTPPSTAWRPKRNCGRPRIRWPRLETYLRAEGLADDAFFAGLKNDGDELAAHVRKATLALGGADIRQKFATVYAQAHPLVAEELAWFEKYEASFSDAETQISGTQGGAA